MYKTVKKITIDLANNTIDIEKALSDNCVIVKDDMIGRSFAIVKDEPAEQKPIEEASYEEFKAEALKGGLFTRKYRPKKSGMQTNLSVWFEVFEADNGNGTRYIDDFPTYEQAVKCAGDKYCVDMIIALETDNGDSILEDGDNLYTVQVYPEFKQYKRNMKPIITME